MSNRVYKRRSAVKLMMKQTGQKKAKEIQTEKVWYDVYGRDEYEDGTKIPAVG